MKALEILKEQYSTVTKDIDEYWIEPKKVGEAIKELEALLSRSCDNCLHEKSCDIVVADNKKFYCSDWESK